jgi:hypothetical protein
MGWIVLAEAAPTPDWLQARLLQHEQEATLEALRNSGYGLYLVLFVLGAVLLLAWAGWPRERVLTWRSWRCERALPGLAGALLLLLLCAVSQQLAIDDRRGFIADVQRRTEADLRRAAAVSPQERENIIRSHYMYLPEGDSLRYLSLGNTALAADYLWLTSLQYVSSPFRQRQKFGLMRRFYQGILDLDPHWVEIHVNAGRILSALDPNRTRTEQFFVQAITQNPDDYRLPMEAGRLYVIPPTDPRLLKVYSDKAGYYFEKARDRFAKDPERARSAAATIASLEDLIARLKMEAGYHQVARDYLWKVARDQSAPEALRQVSSLAWLQAESLYRLDLWRRLAAGYRARHGQFPPSLSGAFREALASTEERQHLPAMRGEDLEAGRRGAPPLDAYGHPLRYDPAAGEAALRELPGRADVRDAVAEAAGMAVISPGVQAQRAIQVASIIEAMAQLFHGECQEVLRVNPPRFPRDLPELNAFLRAYHRPPRDPPFTVTDAIGLDLDCTRNPLGGAWDYDPAAGLIRLPGVCAADELFRHRLAAFEGRPPPYFKP